MCDPLFWRKKLIKNQNTLEDMCYSIKILIDDILQLF